MPTALALSPHLDDAAFSCGGTLAELSGAGWQVVIATVFTATVLNPSGFALACQLDKGLSAEVDYMALRRNEDLLATRALGAEPVWLPFAEAPHRGYESAPALFGDLRSEDGIGASLDAAFRTLLAERRPDLVLAPQAIGGHVDHLQVFRALSRLAPQTSILWWRDFPYTVRSAAPREPFAAALSGLPERDVPLGPRAWDAKRAACRCYASQLGFQFGGEAGLDLKLGQGGTVERVRESGGPVSAAPWTAVSA